ncbi:DUF4040 family protein [Zhihengliuella salsuginis]|uniref:Monovalent cation/H+ antiporter subunit A n=1 Tax=Zhihengliuella salsuginis TaxID=578222 RepID=A0ABQ3GHJ7_9MICC|nr:DUF4040 family protein [Zhihengliuella salsuginis]GHD04898.1 monovalent cation/H+ antiporter subunit A [Zhihengliuella salsuginis]
MPGMPLTLLILLVAVAATPVLTRLLGRAAGWPLALAYLGAAAAFTPTATAVMNGERPTWSVEWIPSWGVEFALAADGLGVVFTYIALLIGAAVFAYSTRYLPKGPNLSFYWVMAFFTLAMTGLVLSDDLLLLFICWEFTSLASFLLIARSGHGGHPASMRTLLMTFIGGLFLLAAVGAIVWRTGTFSVSEALGHDVWANDAGFTSLVAVLVLLAAFSKSAQFPFHVWLPDAMAAATPVSAYLHAAAVVKAGIFLLMRFSPAFHETPAWNATLIIIGLFTAALGGWFALKQDDLKKLMAYSTVSQLGFIVATIGVGTEAALTAAVLHTIAHALFKSGLFMMVGVVDHAVHTRDLRRIPQLYRAMPASFAVMVIGCASMAGIPPMIGFVSKEGIFAALLETPGGPALGYLALAAGAAAAVLTFAYCVKITFGGFVDGTSDRPIEKTDPWLLATAALPILVSVAAVFSLSSFDNPLAAATRAALPGSDPHPHISLWHGLTPELVATAIVLAIGVVVIFRRAALGRWIAARRHGASGADVLEAINNWVGRVGADLARAFVVADGIKRHTAFMVSLFSVVVLAGVGLLVSRDELAPATRGLDRPVDLILLVLITLSVVYVCRAKSRIGATVSLSAVGILATVQIMALGAPDVGLTQLLVESLTIIVIMLVLQKLPLRFGQQTRARKTGAIVLAGVVGLAAFAATWALTGRRERSEVANHYLENAYDVTGGHNIVNVILVEFRALDTLGELAVLGMAGIAIIAVLSTVRQRYLDPETQLRQERDEMLQPALKEEGTAAYRAIMSAWGNTAPLKLMLRVINPVLAIVSALLFWRGHNEPGGGFIAALVGSAIVGFIYLSASRDRQVGPPRLPVYLIGGGVAVAVSTGLFGFFKYGSFLQPSHFDIGSVHFSSSLVFDVGVYMAVLGLVMVAFNLLGVSPQDVSRPGVEQLRERTDETVEGELTGPLETVRGERPSRIAARTQFISSGEPPREGGR